MDGGERWRMIRWAGGTQDKTIIDQIMLRFRPIAPKPATGRSSDGGDGSKKEIGTGVVGDSGERDGHKRLHGRSGVRVYGRGESEVSKKDTRPGFISDGSNRVRWVNGAYQSMVSVMKEKENEGQGQSGEIMVWLVTKEKLIPYMYSCAFTCWVRLQYAWKEKKYSSQMVPCDVWRMDCGGFAWRLDVEAALGLGR
ncbi:hypothetical protein GH714_041806 [Hevea brasiliensis]|uniref:DUF7950 domain-containing protein n=1 Tax=Hevea brasiliensis TaxID=3981 RepID=A0A6A6MV55_HEVBR|nr:hypothetical protein GH714_041806 [Hevea brasiliensis]